MGELAAELLASLYLDPERRLLRLWERFSCDAAADFHSESKQNKTEERRGGESG